MSSFSKDKIIKKLKKFLALSKSSNPNEASTALKYAKKLMEEHSISKEDIDLSSIDENVVKSSAKHMPPGYIMRLVLLVATAFGLDHVLSKKHNGVFIHFVGISPRPDLAEYTFTVLRRQLVSSRKIFLKSLNKRLKKSTKTRRADLFAMAWVNEVESTVTEFAQTEREKALVKQYFDANYPALTTHTARKKKFKARDMHSYAAGQYAAEGVTLSHAVNGQKQKQKMLGVAK